MAEKREKEIILEGELGLPRVQEIKTLLLNALEEADDLTVRFGSVSRVDLAFLQLLSSAVLTFRKEGKRFQFGEEGIPPAVANLCISAGFWFLLES